MPMFTYRARTEASDEAAGTVEAEDVKTAAARLRAQGLYPWQIEPRSRPGPHSPEGPAVHARFSAADLAFFARQVSQALAAGVPLVKALALLAGHGHRRVAPIAEMLSASILNGMALADALALQPRAFPSATVALVRAGEAGGALEEALRRIAELAERDAELMTKVRTALTYPAFVLTLGIATLIVLLTVAVPRLAEIFHNLGAPLPWMTRLVLGVSRAMGRIVAVGLPLAIVAVLGLRRHRGVAAVKAGVIAGVRRLPVVRTVLTQADLARWTQTVGLLIGQGLTLTDALALSRAVTTIPRHQTAIGRVLHDVTEGLPLSPALARARLGDPFLHMLVTVGEAEGDLARSFVQAAQAYAAGVDRAVAIVSALIEPVMIIVVGGIVGAIVFSMLLPVFQMSTVIR